jgi:hypothetical protein
MVYTTNQSLGKQHKGNTLMHNMKRSAHVDRLHAWFLVLDSVYLRTCRCSRPHQSSRCSSWFIRTICYMSPIGDRKGIQVLFLLTNKISGQKAVCFYKQKYSNIPSTWVAIHLANTWPLLQALARYLEMQVNILSTWVAVIRTIQFPWQ